MNTTKEQIVNFCNKRLTSEEFDILKSHCGFYTSNFKTIEDFRNCFNLDLIEDLICEDVTNDLTFDHVTETLDYYVELIRIVKKAFHQNDYLIAQLRDCLDSDEFKLVTTFTSICTGDNGVELVDECWGYHYSTLNRFAELLKNMFIDECSQLEPNDYKSEFWQNWIAAMSKAYYKITTFIRNMDK